MQSDDYTSQRGHAGGRGQWLAPPPRLLEGWGLSNDLELPHSFQGISRPSELLCEHPASDSHPDCCFALLQRGWRRGGGDRPLRLKEVQVMCRKVS